MRYGIYRVSASSPRLRVADCEYNADQIIKSYNALCDERCDVVVMPELCVSGATCGDLFNSETFMRGVKKAMERIINATKFKKTLLIIGYPESDGAKRYNASAVISEGKVIGVTAKTDLSGAELRWFSPPADVICTSYGEFDVNAQFTYNELTLSVVIGDVFFNVNSAFDKAVQSNVVANLLAIPYSAQDRKRQLNSAKAISEKYRLCIACANASYGESVTDYVYGGVCVCADIDDAIATKPFSDKPAVIDTDCQKAEFLRKANQCAYKVTQRAKTVEFKLSDQPVECKVEKYPFVKNDDALGEITEMQQRALINRMTNAGSKTAVIGVSGGLDSALAFMVATTAFEKCGRDKKDVIAVIMPGFGTASATKRSARELVRAQGVTMREIDITDQVTRHLEEIGHSTSLHDVTYENAQARYRTYLIMDIANQTGGIALGTGDLSEIALGFSTYNGDHMSMYNVNSSIPKTLVKALIKYHAKLNSAVKDVLTKILETEISPELLPTQDGKVTQKTESILGSYDYHDFILYHAIGCGAPPEKVMFLAEKAFGKSCRTEIKTAMRTFYKRFFASQFKRSCMPDGVKTTSVALSPRGAFIMPSDVCAKIWLDAVDKL